MSDLLGLGAPVLREDKLKRRRYKETAAGLRPPEGGGPSGTGTGVPSAAEFCRLP